MLTQAESSAVYAHGPEAIMALGERLSARMDQPQAPSAALRARGHALAEPRATQSRNSRKPPARDSVTHQTRALRQPSGSKTGGPPGHPGPTLQQGAVPAQTRLHAPCLACGASWAEVAGPPAPERRPVFALPPRQGAVPEQRVRRKACAACGPRQRGPLPAGVACGARYGAGGKGVLPSRNQAPLVPSERSCQRVAAGCGPPGSEGTLAAAIALCAAALAETAPCLTQGLARAAGAHGDETGMSGAGTSRWRPTASTPPWTHYACHAQRGATATKAIGSRPVCGGRALHDGGSSDGQDDCAHGLCHAPHLREWLCAHAQGQRTWAGQMQALLVERTSAVESATAQAQTALAPPQRADDEHRSVALLQAGLAAEHRDPSPSSGQRGRTQQHTSQQLLDRRAQDQAATRAFLQDWAVPCAHNLAERDVRRRKGKPKVSGCLRTTPGAPAFCRIRSDISTMHKQGHQAIAALQSVFLGTPLVPEVPG